MKYNYHDRRFAPVSNSENGETDAATIFHYRQAGDIVWATYDGGEVAFGTLLATVGEQGCLDMRYQQLNRAGEWRGGKGHSILEVLDDGRYRLHESWQWTTGDESEGSSIIEEIINASRE